MSSFTIALTLLVAASCVQAGHLLAPAAPLLHAPLPAPILAPAPILTAPAVVGHAPVLLGHAPVATSTHIAGPIAAHTISRPVATYSTTHTLLGAPLAAPALLARPALPLAAPALFGPAHLAAPFAAPAVPLAAPALLARPALW